MHSAPGRWVGIRWLLGLAWLLQTCDPSHVLAAQAGQQAVVLVALDGFHPSYLDRPVSRHLRSLAQGGVRARWLVPVFPTKTFPNFHSIATGLYPENHGIVSNNMRDSALGQFALWERDAVRDPRWWGGEPIWVTAIRQGRRAASFFWPGSDVAIQDVRPHHYRAYDRTVSNADRVRQVLEWLSLKGEHSIPLITLYLGDTDYAGHGFGPGAPETDSAIARVDSAVGALVSGIRTLGLEHRVNMVVVSDHGMARVDPRKVVYLDDYIDAGSIDPIDLGPFVSLAPVGVSAEKLYRRLSDAHPRLTIYRKSEVPAAYHYRSHPRIPPVIGVLSDGWTATTRRAAARRERVPLGEHGYPPERESMRAIFLARGPAFRDGVVVEPFQNIHIYALLAHVLGLRPAPNDGRLDSVRVMLAAPEGDRGNSPRAGHRRLTVP
ncbi:MAG: ectonucleotide pyrophosphatase/phosphodiesterase [Gemmatimonadales bacterium]